MEAAEQQFFQRWCRASDAQALGNLFDLAAPRLFKVAVHLAGDASTAEDLVQATFLALIEQRTTLDAARPVSPWLDGVLANKAKQLRRERAKPLDVERLHQRSVADPSQPLEQRELAGEVAAAIDRLGEPYRQVLLLRARHGLAVGDIAHVLERDPGTVSVQLHRGLERLRQLLPAGLVAPLLLGLLAPHGLAAVKANVLSEASAAAAAAGWGSFLGGVLVGKKTLVAVGLVVLALLGWLMRPAQQEVDLQAQAAPPALPAAAVGAALPAEPADGFRARESVEPRTGPTFASQVVDAETGAPLANANVALFAGRETTPFELMRDHPEYYRVTSSRLHPHTQGDWPTVVGADELAMVGRRPLISLDKPELGQSPLARTTTDDQGRFSLPASSSAALVEVAIGGYSTRWRPIVEANVPATIPVWRESEFRGEVIDDNGARVAEPLDLLLVAFTRRSKEPPEGQGRAGRDVADAQPRELEGIDFRRVTTERDGTFRALSAGAEFAHAHVLSSGWVVRTVGRPDPAKRELVVQLTRAQMLHFFDQESNQPVERIRLVVRDLQDGRLMSCDELYAPSGIATFPLSESVFASNSYELTAWSAGFETTRWTSTDRSQGRIEVPMRAGTLATLRGRVVRSGAPLDGATIALLGNSTMWSAENAGRHLFDAATARSGEFEFHVPAGAYLLRIREGATEVHSAVQAPSTEPLLIDLDRLARIEVLVVDQTSTPRPMHTVALQGGDSRNARTQTDAEGIAVFSGLPPGKYTVMSPDVNTRGSFQGTNHEVVELAAGQEAQVRLETTASTGPVHARIALRDVEDFTGWRARFSTEVWCDVAADGTISAELTAMHSRADVLAPDGRAWRAFFTMPAPNGIVIQLEEGAGQLQGELLGEGNRQHVGVRILMKPSQYHWSVGDVVPWAVSDSAGRFSFTGLARTPYSLAFERRELALPMEFVLTPGAESGAGLVSIRLATPREEIRLSGTVRDRAGKWRSDAVVFAAASIPQLGGSLRVGTDRQYTKLDTEGRFHFTLPRTPEIVLRVRTPEGWQTAAERTLLDDGSSERTVDLTID